MKRFHLLLTLLFIKVFSIVANAQPGANDPSFNPNTGANYAVSVSVVQSDGKIIIGGGFNSYNGTGRIGITRLNANSSLDETFNSAGTGADNWVNTIAIQSDGKIIIGGDFGNYNGTSRNRIARLNADGSLDPSFNPGTGANGRIETCIIQSDGKIIIGGWFGAYNGTLITRIARLNADGSIDPSFNPGTGANNIVKSIAIQSDGKIIIGGWFTSYNGIARNRIARLLTDGSNDATLNAGTGTDNAIEKCTIQSDGRIIISGEFTNYNGTARSRIARLNADGSLDGTFNPGTGASSSIWPCVIQSDGKIIIGGFFTSYNGTSRNRIARLNTDGSIDVTFNPGTGADNWIYTTAIQSDGKIFIGGEFLTYNGGARNYSARLNTDGSLDGTFNPGGGASNQVYTSAIQSDGKIIIGGQFTNYNGTAINRIARINANGSIDETFNPGTGVNSLVWTSAIQNDGKIIIGGQFITYNGIAINRIARLNTDGSLDGTFIPGTGAGNTVNTTAIQSDGKIIIGGNFTSYNGTAINRIARLNADGTLDGTFNPGTGANNQVYTIAIQSDGKIIIAGNFTSYNGTAINRIARLNTDGTLDGTFSVGTGANNLVGTSVIQSDGKIIIGGNFSSYNGTAINRIVRLNANGSIDGTFNVGTGVNGTIERSTIQSDGKIIIVGSFTDYNGTTRNRIARLNTDGTIDATLNPVGGPNSTVNTISIQSDGKIIFGGIFTSYNGISRNRLARILGDCINNTVTPPSSTPSVCINLTLTNITHTTTGATGIGIASGLPAGVTANWAAGTITISGTPTANGIFNYSIPLTGGCGIVSATGTITVILINTVSAASSPPIECINNVITNITHTTAGASGIGAATGLPPGLTANWAANIITISGTPTVTGIYNYTIPLTGGCGVISATGTINIIASAPTQVPVAFNFARTLSTNSLPPGAISQWYKNNVLIPGATALSYYAADAGTFTVKFINDCGTGPASNAITFPAAVQAQTISFPHVPTQSMSPTAKARLSATASSALPVFYQVISGPGSIINDSLRITSVGTIIVKALQPGDDVYSAAPTVNDTITVIKGNQVITFDSLPDMVYGTSPNFLLTGSSTSGLTIDYITVPVSQAGYVYYIGGGYTTFTLTGAGTVTLRASQPGDGNYNAAAPVERTFCIGLRTLGPITGDANPCIATYRYNTQKIPGANFVWTLSGGGILTTNNDTAWVQWQTPGNYTLTVKANSPCDPVYTNTQSLAITTSTNMPGAVSNMLPANNAVDQQLPLTLSWIPGNNTVNYDLFLWDSAAVEPVTPYASNITTVSYVIPLNALVQNKTYKWKIVSKNPCSQTAGPIQKFKVIPLPDLVVSDVQAPATANSGQTITISWKVTNIGPGRTLPGTTWSDGVYFALDTLPSMNFNLANWDPNSWNSISGNGVPLLLGKKERPSSLDSGQFYTNSLNFTLPLNYNFPVYVYVITDNQHPNYKILQVSVANDTARKQNPILISLAPTPDLRVDSVFSPASTFSGSTVNLTYKVKNYGVVTPAGASWNDAVYMSQSPLFDSSTAIRVKAAKANGSYYPAGNAQTTVNTQLLPDSTYTRNMQVVVPNFIFGTWFFYVKANDNKTLYEGALSNNNINQAQLQVYLTPTPKLTVSTLTVPVTVASTTQPIGANWNIKNEGFTDNIEKNKGHYLFNHNGMCRVCSVLPPYACENIPTFVDSLALGSSYWLDRIYLSTDSSGLNVLNATLIDEIKHGVQQYSGLLYPDDMTGLCGYSGVYNVSAAIKPGSDFPKSLGFNIPSHLQPDNYYVYVYTNPTKTVFEYPGTAQIKRSTLPITINRPDVTVPTISVPANVNGGQQFAINYSVLNNGPGAVFSHIRRDRIYVSNFSTFDGSAQLIDSTTSTESLAVGTAAPHSFTYTFPPATTGAKYFFVLTNYDSAFRETNSLNNLSAAAMTIVSAALPADLIVSNIQMPDTTFTIFTQSLSYTVFNNGTGTTAGTWTDSVYFSCSPTFNFSTNNFMAKKSQTRAVPPGGSYTDTITFTIPNMSYVVNPCFPQTANQNAYFFIKTNSGLTIYEGGNINNNVTGTGSRVFTNPLVDHIVTTVSAPDTTTVGFAYPVNWRVKNIGYNPNNNYYYLWVDAIYFSADSIADETDLVAGEYLKYLQLNRGQDSADSKSPYTPVLLTGDYYVYVKTNSRNSIAGEKVLSNNVNFIRNGTGAAKKIHVIRPLLADLTDTIVSAPVSAATGQPITVIYKITNNGTGTTYPGTSWQNDLLLSVDFFANPNDGDRLLAHRYRNAVLLPGQFYYDTVTVTIPSTTVPGNYVLISKTNVNNIVVESNINNNLGFSLLNVFTPPVTDLTVANVIKPDTVYLGYTMDTARWVITNTSAQEARGYTSDGVYLSASNLFDSTAVLIGIKNKNIIMPPLQSDTVWMTPLVTGGVAEGNYNVFVKTDLLNQILESNKNNNTGMSATPIYVKVKELLLNVPEPATLHTINRYYKLRIPDSLRGSTILVTLKTNDSLTMKNEIFIGGGYVPTAAHYNYRFEIPNYGNQQIVMTSVTDSLYYIMVRCVSPNPLLQNITLKAVKLPFAILNVHTNTGGNIGNVTVRIRGSLYRDSMVAKLSNGTTTIYSSAVYFTNSTQVYATFPLQGKPLGVYDVTLVKPDSSVAILPNGFSIVPANNGGLITGGGVNTGAGNGNAPGCDPGAASGLNSQLVVELVVPQRVLVLRAFVILINYNNPTNFDIPAQSRILYSEAGMKLAFTKEAVPTGTTSLYLEIVESDGPPGIIRAGGSGTIVVHTRAPLVRPQPNPFVQFKLK